MSHHATQRIWTRRRGIDWRREEGRKSTKAEENRVKRLGEQDMIGKTSGGSRRIGKRKNPMEGGRVEAEF